MRRLLFLRMLLRRHACAAPLVLLLALLYLCYQTLKVDRNRNRSESEEMETRRVISALDALQEETQVRRQAVVLMGRHGPSDPEVVLHQQVLQQMGYQVHLTRFAETSSFLRIQSNVSGWSLLLCLSSSEPSCLRRIRFSHLQHQMVNLLPELMEAFSDAGEGRCRFYLQLTEADLPMRPVSCGSSNQKPPFAQNRPSHAPSPALVAMVNVFVLVTSVTPLTSFLHDIIVVKASENDPGQQTQIRTFLLQRFGPASARLAWIQVQRAVVAVLQVASTNQEPAAGGSCLLCFQLLTFTLMFSGAASPAVVQVDPGLSVPSQGEDAFRGQITRDRVLEDSLRLLLPLPTHLQTHRALETLRRQYGGCRGTHGSCLNHDHFLFLLRFHLQLQMPSAFHLLHPSSSSSSSPPPSLLLLLLLRISRHHDLQSNREANPPTNQQPALGSPGGLCLDPRLRQIYSEPPLSLTPPFSPALKEYRAEVPFDTVMVRIRPEPISAACVVCLDNHRGPRTANFPVGMGTSQISILVTDGAEPRPVVMTIYTVHVYRESRPSLPAFGDHVTCSFLQDCGMRVQPGRSCGLQPHLPPQSPVQPCSSGHVPGNVSAVRLSTPNKTRPSRSSIWERPENTMLRAKEGTAKGGGSRRTGWSRSLLVSIATVRLSLQSGGRFSYHLKGRWVVPCLSCSDNRTCDWREVTWQPDDCYHPPVRRPLLQDCMSHRKVMFIGDSTNRGMMFFLMERVNGSLQDWGRAHHTLLYRNLNQRRTQVSYSYYPRFWLEGSQRPTFRQALLQLINRSRPLENSNQTVLVVGGVQWLNSNHLRTVQDVLDRESLSEVLVVVKSLGMGFHLPVDGIRSLSLTEIRGLFRDNAELISTARRLRFEAVDTFSITMGRYKEFLQGRCACHFHEVEKLQSSDPPDSEASTRKKPGTRTGSHSVLDTEQEDGSKAPTFRVRGAVNQVYSEILLSRMCPGNR
ncbi:cadherin-like and PC-esterase domain-containing protein 1 isoform X1 [Poecilia latipinna]|uniref:cadherin-like and PC-esterase domain-containing protein 1 isoform X1 n=1 Tax=Poecilia latipinna TaxID=48699 RepID=UPI00072DCCC3|nr:PREDICTED: cadherin-like and PC-esterase domain-containing protein 1 isoform X1 [Poecilia latipinna]